MGIASINTDVAGQIGINPRRVKMVSYDNYATITAAGYLSPELLGGFAVYPTDIFDVIYNYVAATNSGSYVQLAPAFSNGVITLGATNVTLPVVSGNLAQFSGTSGLESDSGISAASISGAVTQLGTLHSVSVTLTPTQMAAAYATPQTLIANPLASQMILILAAQVYTASTGNTPYATGTAPIIQYSSGGTNGAHGAGTIATASGLVAGDIDASTSQVRNLLQFASGAQTGLSGLGIYFSNATGAYTGGTGTNITFTLTYLVLTATV